MIIVPIDPLRSRTDFTPTQGTKGSAGHDLRAALDEPYILKKGEVFLVPCGIKLAIPEGWVGLVCPRSGLALKHKITVFNSPGVIDSDYRGVIHVMLINHGEDYTIQPGERVGQLLFVRYDAASFAQIPLDDTDRSTGGFGSTGK